MARLVMKRAARPTGGAPALLDEAFHLLRSRPATVLLHAIGAMPFGLGLLLFWSDMSRSAYAAERCVAESLALAGLYMWMKTWHSRFMSALYAQAAGLPEPAWSVGRFLRAAAMQALFQATAAPVLCLAALVVLPSASCITFYQNVVLYGSGDRERWRDVVRLSWAQAVARPVQTHAVLAVLSLLALVVYVELLVGLLFLPHLLRLFTGTETVLTQGAAFLLNSTTLAIAGVLCYLVVDPLLKAVCVLRCFREQALSTGEDLLVTLRRLPEGRLPEVARRMACWAVAGLVLTGVPVGAEPAVRPAAVDPPALGQQIERTLAHPRYSWRSPRQRPPRAAAERSGAIARFFRQIDRWVRQALDSCRGLRRDLQRWLQRLFRIRDPQATVDGTSASGWEQAMPYVVAVAIAATVAGLAVLAWRSWLRRRRSVAGAVQAVAGSSPDLADEAVLADQRPGTDWLRTARELIERGELRLGLRAVHLASLALLAERQLLTIVRCKSNLDYRRELARRAAHQPELVGGFERVVQAFDGAWYGDHVPSLALVGSLLAEVDRMGVRSDT